MKRFLPGLRTEILLSLTVLLVTAMLLTSFVVSRIWERDLLRYKAADGKALIQKIQAVVDTLSADGAVPLDVIKTQLEQFAAENVPAEIFDPLVIQAKDGALWAGDRESRQTFGVRDFMFSKALDMKKGAFHVGREKNLLLVSAPVFVKDRPIAVVQAPVRIDGVLQGLRRSEHLIWFYIGLNVLVLVVFGTFLLSRIVIRPMKRLVKTAEDFENTNGPYSFRKPTEHNEIGRLAMSLNSMLKRLAENRHEMETQIQSLEKANMELKEARDEVLRSEKLSCLGRLSAGVAHEVGNPLGSILGYTGLLMAHVKDDPEARDYLQRIESEISRINTIVRELLDYSRSSPGNPSPVDINALILEAVTLFSHQRLIGDVRLETQLAQDVGRAWVDADQLKQVLINLLFNACDALDGTGQITIYTALQPRPLTPGVKRQPHECIEITVSDTGAGIPVSDQEQIFDPFFTTKPPGKGTGLGLAISRRLVESFDGRLEVDSREGKGSTFTIRLNPWKPSHDTQRSNHRSGRDSA